MGFFLVEPRGHVLPVTRHWRWCEQCHVSHVSEFRVDTDVQLMGTTNPRVQLPNWSQTRRLTARSLQ